jgi:endonuclease/exonuclease/phosphatase family metal-dependent hydrolase
MPFLFRKSTKLWIRERYSVRTSKPRHVAALEQDQERRLNEIRVLVKEVQKPQAEGTYLGAIIGGDFNFEPDDPEYRELEHAGLRDTYTMATPKPTSTVLIRNET